MSIYTLHGPVYLIANPVTDSGEIHFEITPYNASGWVIVGWVVLGVFGIPVALTAIILLAVGIGYVVWKCVIKPLRGGAKR